MNTQISKTFCIHHQADIDIISHCKMELLLMAKNKHRGIIFIESQDISSILIIPRNLRDHVNVELIVPFHLAQSIGQIIKVKVLIQMTKIKTNYKAGQQVGTMKHK